MDGTHTMDDVDFDDLGLRARRMRATCIRMAYDGREGHLKSTLSCIDLLLALYGTWLRVSPDDPRHPDRDRFLLSKGHGVTALYAALAEYGFMPPSLLDTYAQPGGALPNHACRHALPLLEISSGSLGHGLGMATGMAYGMELDGRGGRVAVLMSDGECNEGSVWESAMFAAARRLDRVVAIIDNNNMQAVGRNDEISGGMPLDDKFRAFGWAVRTIDGHDLPGIVATLRGLPFEPGKPSAIVARTVGGSGVSFMEDQMMWHYRSPSAEDVERALAELGVAPLHRATP
ncbi:Transketolase, N-terminal section (EC 2.2.1.1) [Azospirillum argentinense]